MSARVLSRSSTGRTNRDAAGLEPPRTAYPQQGRLKRPQLPRSSSRESGRGSNRSSSGSARSKALGKPAGGANGVPVLPVTQREPSPDMRQRVAQDLADDFDRHCLIDKVYDKVYRSFEKSREAFRSFDPLGKGEIPVEEFLDAIGKKFCLSFSARERKLMREHCQTNRWRAQPSEHGVRGEALWSASREDVARLRLQCGEVSGRPRPDGGGAARAARADPPQPHVGEKDPGADIQPGAAARASLRSH